MMSTAFLFMLLSLVVGQQTGVYIYQVTPSELTGTVGQYVNVQGTIDISNGAYQVWFGNNLAVNNTAEGFYVNANFTIPEILSGNYTITLRDVKENVNATQEFTVLTAYSIKALVPSPPELLQEGSSVTLNVTITAGQASTAYNANITVVLPAPLNTGYSKSITLTTSQKGTAQAQLTYPDTSFQPAGSLTNYTGSYQIYFNQTEQLAADQLFVGFTNSNAYHRGETATIRAIGYQPDENSTITITSTETGAVVHSASAMASIDGVINAAWPVPSNAVLGDYNITITPQNTPKLIPDSQIVTVPGYPITIRTLNLAGDPVPQLAIEALDEATNTIYNTTSEYDGKATVNLENGNHTLTAFWNDVKVGEITVSITGESSFDLT
jgi:hypothetical protein